VTVDQVARTSPLGSRAAQLQGTPTGIRLEEVAFLTQLNLRLNPEGPALAAVEGALRQELPVRPGTLSGSGDRTLLWLGPDEWLLVAPPGEQAELLPVLRTALSPHGGVVVDLSAHRTTIDVHGALARDLMAKGCSLDLHPSVLTPDRCAQVLLARAPVILLPHESGPGLRLLVRSSFAGYVADWLLDACVEYGPAAEEDATAHGVRR
jgi:sarcosine oxidase, subunit gamma